MFDDVIINYWAAGACVAGSMLLGYVWYSMPVFGRVWMVLVGKTEEDLKKGSGPAMGVAVILALLITYVMAHLISYTDADTVTEGLTTAAWLWLGFPFAVIAMQNIFALRPWKLTLITTGYHLVQFLMIGAILAMWK